MGKQLTRVGLDIIYLDEIFRDKEFNLYEDIKELPWFPIAELLETYSDSNNLRIIIIKSASDYLYMPSEMNGNKYSVIEQMIASFDDEGTLIITYDNSVFDDNYADINMYPIVDGNDKIHTYVYENAPGAYILDNMKGEESNDI